MCDFICLETRHICGFEGMEVVIFKYDPYYIDIVDKMIMLKIAWMPHRLEA